MRAREGDLQFEAVFHLHYERIARVVVRIVKDPARAEELAVEVFWRLSKRPEALGEGVGGWLYRSAVRAALYDLRREARRSRGVLWARQLWPFHSSPATPEETHASAEQQRHVRTVLAAMNTRQAELLLLRASGLSYQEVAAALSLNPASVGTLVSRAQRVFRKEYVKRYGEP